MTFGEWLETVVGLMILAGTKDAAKVDRDSGLNSNWCYVYGGYVFGLDWPIGLWADG
jgi:hypothetical protein